MYVKHQVCTVLSQVGSVVASLAPGGSSNSPSWTGVLRLAVRPAIFTRAARLSTRLLSSARATSRRNICAVTSTSAGARWRSFGCAIAKCANKDGLLAALAILAFDRYLAEKHTVASSGDPVDDLRRGWDVHIGFGLRHPAHYLLMFSSDRPDRRPPAADEAYDLLMQVLGRVAVAGRLRVPPILAARLLGAAATGVTLSLIADPEESRDLEVSARMREIVIGFLVTDPPPAVDSGLAPRALALDAAIAAADETSVPLRPAETALLRDWLHRLAR